MSENEFTKKDYLEKDILDILDKAVSERNNLGFKSGSNNKDIIKVEVKDYSNYRKLIDLLSKVVNTYRRVNYNDYNAFYIEKLLLKLNKEIDTIHSLMEESLKIDYMEQYGCLTIVHLKLIEIVDYIERSKPIAFKLNENYTTNDCEGKGRPTI